MKIAKFLLMSLIIGMTFSACSSSNKSSVYGKKKKGISQPANGRMQGIN
ncbi:MAG: hypothetical protein MRY83_20770 [Flavobacteriales bacterium]|nr:hypothetical protein [Flavobacteriales bacterium]